jgi:geranylgeranyl diphosphate synthase type I
VFNQFMARYLSELDATMRQVVDLLAPQTPDFGVMIRYALGWVDQDGQPYHTPTGKRIRPVLLLLCAETAGGDWQQALPAAAAVELLHNFSLIHDDIQDDSPTRHNRPTVWKIWGRANAINAGDALFTLSHSALERLSATGISDETVLKAWGIFNNTTIELTRGQHLDMRFEHQPNVAVDEYLSMIQGKSAALLAACAQIGALVASGDEALAAQYADFGLNLGLAFQIRDDILGIWGDPAVTGKSAATDIVSRKKSLPVLYGLSQSAELAALYQRQEFGDTEVQAAVQLLDSLGAQDFAQRNEALFYQRAIASLESARPQGNAARWLMELVNSLFGRTY